MARKRRIDSIGPPPQPEEEEIPEKYQDKGWSHWMRDSYARYWYIVGCIALDIILPLEVARRTSGIVQVVAPAVLLCGLVAAEVVLYLRWWPRTKDED